MTRSKRQQMRARRQRQALMTRLFWGGLGALALALIGFLFWGATRPPAGEEMPAMADASHVPEGSDPGPYSSDPPSSGRHYPSELEAGFYEENVYPYPAGYLVHNLEHGYVIIWYNCDLLSAAACDDLKAQIEAVMEEAGNSELIAYPWPSLEVPVAMTSWGMMQRFETFDPEQAVAFIRANRNSSRAPEPGAQ